MVLPGIATLHFLMFGLKSQRCIVRGACRKVSQHFLMGAGTMAPLLTTRRLTGTTPYTSLLDTPWSSSALRSKLPDALDPPFLHTRLRQSFQ